jgi:tRNA dimethylallyltransferase
LGKKYGWNHESMTGNIYQVLRSYLEGGLTLSQAKEQFTTLDWQLAKRQMTWFRRNPDILWATLPEAKAYVNSLLAG